jgi:chromatin assembly factor 1 subunit B
MRFRTLEIRWHDSKPISTCDFQPLPFKKARPQDKSAFAGQAYRLATGGEDNHVRVWMVHPNIMPPSVVSENASTSNPITPRPPRVEYLATLSKHTAAVNVVRFSPNGDLIASAGDDGMILIWAPSSNPQVAAYGSDLGAEDLQYEKEHWKPRTIVRCTQMQVYDLAWSPSGEYIIAGSTDNVARVFASSDGKCVHEIAEHSHYVQGVAWDPLNEYIATQSSDRSMHIYRISTKNGVFEAHAVGKNTRIVHHHSRTPSTHSTTPSRPRQFRSHSTTSDAESVVTTASELLGDGVFLSGSQYSNNAPLTPATSVASTPSASMFPPPPIDKPSSRRSSFSGSNAPSSPSQFNRYGRSPSPMPALPAIRTLPSAAAWASVKLYGDESFTNFFRRLTFSPDGGLLLTPAGQFEDPSVVPGSSRSKNPEENTPSRGRKGRSSANATETANPSSASSVYIYSRANFARPPIAQLPGHKKASVAVRFSPILFELRQGMLGSDVTSEPRTAVLEKEKEGRLNVDLVDSSTHDYTNAPASPQKTPLLSPAIAAPAPSYGSMPSPALSPLDSLRPGTPAPSKPSTPAPASHITPTTSSSVFALPYRMLFAVVTMDTVAIYDTQQVGPVAMLTKLHYDEFTDMTWTPDGQCLLLSSRDGYCTIVMFDEILPAHHTQQHALQLQMIAQHHSVPISFPSSNSGLLPTSTTVTPAATPSTTFTSLPQLTTPAPSSSKKRSEPPLTPTTSEDNVPGVSKGASAENDKNSAAPEPPKKKRRVALTRVGDLGS